jgi:hypothetical protein
MKQSPDLDGGPIILIPRGDLHQPPGFSAWTPWTFRHVERLYQLPEGDVPARLFFLRPDWRRRAANSGDLFDGVRIFGIDPAVLEQHRGRDIHFYSVVEGKLRRITGPLEIGEHKFEISPPPPAGTAAPYPKRALYKAYILPPGDKPVKYTAAN